MPIRYPQSLTARSRIGVTAPSTGITPDLEARFQHCVRCVEKTGFEVVVGDCLRSTEVVSACPEKRAAELLNMLSDPSISAIVPPWGGELLIQILPLLDFETISRLSPKWLVGFSDLSTLLLPFTLSTGIATLHGSNFMETAYEAAPGHTHWLEAVGFGKGSRFEQRSSAFYQTASTRYQENPEVSRWNYSQPVEWKVLGQEKNADREVLVSGRLIGGCLDVISMLPGTPFGDVSGFAGEHAPEGLLFYVELCEEKAFTACRMLHHLKLAGWFDQANAVLVGRTAAVSSGDFTQRHALFDALGDLEVPVIYDMDIGHVPPQLMLVNGAKAELRVRAGSGTLVQSLV